MMYRPLVILLFLSFTTCLAQNSKHRTLFPIVERGKYGFIDSTGEVVIPPLFATIGSFAGELAPARLDGRYGYIDRTGSFVIEPQFDFATEFSEGFAVAYIDDRSMYVDRSGKRMLEGVYNSIEHFKEGRARVTSSHGTGIIDRSGQLIIDTAYALILPFKNGRAIAKKYCSSSGRTPTCIGLIDTTGATIVPFGLYHDIDEFSEGYAIVKLPTSIVPSESKDQGIIDTIGTLVWKTGPDTRFTLVGKVRNGRLRIRYEPEPDSQAIAKVSSFETSYAGLMDVHGTIVHIDTSCRMISSFNNRRAFAYKGDRQYELIDPDGNRIAGPYESFKRPGFFNNIAFVFFDQKWQAIDTLGHILFSTDFRDIATDRIRQGYMVYSIIDTSRLHPHNVSPPSLYGLADSTGTVIIPARFTKIGMHLLQQGVLEVTEEGRFGYVDLAGNYLWKRALPGKARLPINNNFQARSHYSVMMLRDSTPGSNNRMYVRSESVRNSMGFPDGTVSIVAEPDLSDTYSEYFQGFRVYVVNSTSDSIQIPVLFEELHMVLQALGRDSIWKDIEKYPQGFCSPAIRNITLGPGMYLPMTAPLFQGDCTTKLRFKLLGIRRPDTDERGTLYSNEFEGSINRSQLWNNEQYQNDLMSSHVRSAQHSPFFGYSLPDWDVW